MEEPVTVQRLILPPAEAERFVREADRVYVRDCPCRVEEQACPREKWEVCLLFKHASAEDLAQGREISIEEAERIVRMTTERGDVHMLMYLAEGMRPYELCNCCYCCCFPLREAREAGHYPDRWHSQYVAVTDLHL